jgi:hypothetical protein
LTQTFFDHSGLFKGPDDNGAQRSGTLQNRSGHGLDYAGTAATGAAVGKIQVFDVKSSWNGWAKGMTEGPDSMARRVIRSAEHNWKVGQETKDYATYLDKTQGDKRKFEGYVIQFDKLGDSTHKNHVRMSTWKN